MFILDIPPVYEKKWKNIVADRLQTEIWHMRFACWIPKTTNTHSEYVILTAFSMKQWLHEHASMLCYITLPVFFHSIVTFYFQIKTYF